MSPEPIDVQLVDEKIEAVTQRSLVRKLSEVMAAVGYIQKKGYNEAQKYNYATEADVADIMRAELAKRQVFIFPSLVSCSRTRVERPGYKPELPNRVSYATDLVMRWTFVDGESGERMECDIPGCSESPGDKGVYVAMTGSEKYLLMKSFLIPTGDDPENTANEPQGTTADAKAVADEKLAAYKKREQEQLIREKLAPSTVVAKTQENAPQGASNAKKGTSSVDSSAALPNMRPIDDVKQGKKKDGSPMWKVKIGGVEYSTFDSKIAALAAQAMAQGQEVDAITGEKDNPQRPGQPFLNLLGFRRIHSTFFEDDGHTPIRDVNQDLMDAELESGQDFDIGI